MTRKNKKRRTWDEDGSRQAQLVWTLCVAVAVAVAALYRVGSPTAGQVFAARAGAVSDSSARPDVPALKTLDQSTAEAEMLPPGVERVPASEGQSARTE